MRDDRGGTDHYVLDGSGRTGPVTGLITAIVPQLRTCQGSGPIPSRRPSRIVKLTRYPIAPSPASATVTALLDAIPGAYERAQQGLRETRSGQGIRLEDL